jgi:hypothetical protein
MKRTQVSLVVLGLLALVGGGTALAAKGRAGAAQLSGGPLRTGVVGHRLHGPGELLGTAASYLGLTPTALATQLQTGQTLAQIADATSGKSAQGLVDALVAAEKKSLADAVAAQRLTQAQADRISQTLAQRTTDLVDGTFRAHRLAPGRGFGHPGRSDDLQAAADYLGTTVSALATQLQSGKTLAAIASATTGKSTSGLVAALVAHEKTELADAVKAGRIAQAQADRVAATLTQRFTALVNGALPAHGAFRNGGGPHPGSFFGRGHRI